MSFVKQFVLMFTLAGFIYPVKYVVPDQIPNIQSAIERSNEGDTVYVRIGHYHESITLRNGIFLTGESMTHTIISGTRKHPVISAGDKTTIRKLTIQNGTVGIRAENAMCTIEEVVVRNNTETGIHCLVTLPNIYNCIIRSNRWSGILCESTRSIKTSIMHNVIAENGNNGITLEGVSEVLIMNNVFFANNQFGIWGIEESRKSRIIYNLFYGNRSTVNHYLTRDPSNILDNPGYPFVNGAHDYLSTSSVILKGKGKDGATIGLVGGEVLTQKLTDPDEDNVSLQNDKCPSIPEDIDGFEDTDGCPEFDNDQDGFFDAQDACPASPEDYDGFRDDDGCLDDDNDKDGIPDSNDTCKDSPETVNSYKDTDGCPDETPLVPPQKTDSANTVTPADK